MRCFVLLPRGETVALTREVQHRGLHFFPCSILGVLCHALINIPMLNSVDVNISVGSEQRLYHVPLLLDSSCLAVKPFRLLCVGRQAPKRHRFLVLDLSGKVGRCQAVLVRGMYVSLRVQKSLHDLQMPKAGRTVQGGHANLIGGPHIRIGTEQGGHHKAVTSESGGMHSGCTHLVTDVHAGLATQKHFHHFVVTVVGCEV
mmetsp:Transcript_1252/g.2800  ORF Transcript_1252/g.2800 Transcript_1252/m.2800 type:complete len:201 (+) Transcript_1252:1960-2562(+)